MTTPQRFLCLLLSAAGAWSQDAPFARRPYVQNVREDRAVILWNTLGATGAGTVRYGETGAAAREVRATVREFPPEQTGLSGTLYQHRAELRDLQAGKFYRYRVLVDGVDVAPLVRPDELSFTTASPGPFEFLVFGDSGDGGRPQHDLADLMMQERPALVLHTGDLAYQQGTFSHLENFYLRTYWPLMRRAPFFPVPGNHDYDFPQAAAYLAIHDVPAAGVAAADRGRYYSFDWGNVHFTALDSNTPMLEALDGQGEMLRWLERDLAATRQTFRVVYFHHPPFPTANYREDEYCQRLARELTVILERHGVHLVLLGHEHLYQRTKPHRGGFRETFGTVYVTTGGGGSTVYPPVNDAFLDKGVGASHYLRVRATAHELRVQAIGLGAAVLDEFTVSAAPRIEADGVRDAASGLVMLAPGTLASVYGMNFTAGDTVADGSPLPKALGGMTITLDGQALPLYYAGRNQVNFQMPYGASPGNHELIVETAAGQARLPVPLRAVAPSIFRVGGQAALLHADGALVTASRPAAPGEVLSLFLTGLGRPMASVADGQPAPATPPMRVASPIRVDAGNRDCEVIFAGLAPGFAGLNQVNFRVPANITSGVVPLRVIAGEVASAAVSVAIR